MEFSFVKYLRSMKVGGGGRAFVIICIGWAFTFDVHLRREYQGLLYIKVRGGLLDCLLVLLL